MAVLSKNLINTLDEEVLIALGKGTDEDYDHSQLSREELKLLLGICEGKTNKELATAIFKEEATVEYRCRSLANRIKIKNRRNSFIAFAIKYGFWYPEKSNF
jgi:DNA-binding NarL/FixJ family response regulator